jgi:hypothetical protein
MQSGDGRGSGELKNEGDRVILFFTGPVRCTCTMPTADRQGVERLNWVLWAVAWVFLQGLGPVQDRREGKKTRLGRPGEAHAREQRACDEMRTGESGREDRDKGRSGGCAIGSRDLGHVSRRELRAGGGRSARREADEKTPTTCSTHCRLSEHGRARPKGNKQSRGRDWDASRGDRGGSWRGGMGRITRLRLRHAMSMHAKKREGRA